GRERKEAAAVQGQVRLGPGRVGRAALRGVVVEVPAAADVGAKDPTHEEDVIADIFAYLALPFDTGACRRNAHRLAEHLHDAVHRLAFDRTQAMKLVGAREVGQDAADVLDDLTLADSQLTQRAAYQRQEESTQAFAGHCDRL